MGKTLKKLSVLTTLYCQGQEFYKGKSPNPPSPSPRGYATATTAIMITSQNVIGGGTDRSLIVKSRGHVQHHLAASQLHVSVLPVETLNSLL